jgi:hypothetical protein
VHVTYTLGTGRSEPRRPPFLYYVRESHQRLRLIFTYARYARMLSIQSYVLSIQTINVI